jgi:hypothetical protein
MDLTLELPADLRAVGLALAAGAAVALALRSGVGWWEPPVAGMVLGGLGLLFSAFAGARWWRCWEEPRRCCARRA